MYTGERIVDAIENCLNEREQQIIKTRFGIDDGIPVRLEEIELIFGASREQLISELNLSGNETILDLGCGE